MYGELVYRIGKHYTQERQRNPDVEFPFFSGQIADLVDQDTLNALPELQGEYVIAYKNGEGASHVIHVYFEQGTFEAEGMPLSEDAFNLSADVGQFTEE
ncbi:MAG: hypothetical protein GX573_08140 [Chloroflexi bacterium]|nr:hypothetical protein [Chloroflexota bacterium]